VPLITVAPSPLVGDSGLPCSASAVCACAARPLPPGSARCQPTALPGHRSRSPTSSSAAWRRPHPSPSPLLHPTLKRRRSLPAQVFLPVPLFPRKEHAESTPSHPLASCPPWLPASPPLHREIEAAAAASTPSW
jgi:hypothetical protein